MMANLAHYDSLDLFQDLVKNVFRPLALAPLSPLQENGETPDSRLIRMEVVELDKAYRILAELPGIRKEDVNVAIDGDRVMLSAESKREKSADESAQQSGERILVSERFHGKFRRSIQLPEAVDDSGAEARYRDGVLELTLPKKKAREVKRIQIQ
jgi:HSP20 family protein